MIIYRIDLPLVFPAGISAGEGTDGNRLTIARDGQGRAVLRGSSLAGALRQALRQHLTEDAVQTVFGSAAGAGDPQASMSASRLEVGDVVLGTDKTILGTDGVGPRHYPLRTHNLINRHTGTVIDQGLFSIEATPRNIECRVVLWLRDDEILDDGPGIVKAIASVFSQGLLLGGRTNRGVGMARLKLAAESRQYDLSQLNDHADYLDDHRHWRNGEPYKMSQGKLVDGAAEQNENILNITLHLKIPRGQDLLVAAGEKTEIGPQPQVVIGSDGKDYWHLPGSTLRGIMRAWVSRLAAREGKPVAFSLQKHRELGDKVKADDLARCFLSVEEVKAGKRPDCVVCDLFGSMSARGRLHISDSFIPRSEQDSQRRKHVAIDRITGGANDGALFSNDVIVASPGQAGFEVLIQLKDPKEDEARWLANTIRALDVGVLRLGSSKASGRLSLAQPPDAKGAFSDYFTQIQPYSRAANKGGN